MKETIEEKKKRRAASMKKNYKTWKQKNKEHLADYKKAWSEKHPGYFAVYSKAWREQNPEKNREAQRAYRQKHPIQYMVYKLVHRKIREQKIERPVICSACGVIGERIEGHHMDYDRPYDLTWLCYSCHKHLDTGRKK
jgi:formylmethanofuran dehydrogenase subunit E